MNILVVAISALKLGLYAPCNGTLPLLPYLGTELVAPDHYRPGLEAGVSLEPAYRQTDFKVSGQYGRRSVYMGTALLGLSWSHKRDLTFNVGARYRVPDQSVGPYAGVSLRLGSVKWGD